MPDSSAEAYHTEASDGRILLLEDSQSWMDMKKKLVEDDAQAEQLVFSATAEVTSLLHELARRRGIAASDEGTQGLCTKKD